MVSAGGSERQVRGLQASVAVRFRGATRMSREANRKKQVLRRMKEVDLDVTNLSLPVIPTASTGRRSPTQLWSMIAT